MSPDPVTVRLLDPPMHEFLPTEQQLIGEIESLRLYRDVARGRQVAVQVEARAADSGHSLACRFGSGYPRSDRLSASARTRRRIGAQPVSPGRRISNTSLTAA